MASSTMLLSFVSDVNDAHYAAGGDDLAPLSYWDSGNVHGINLYGHPLWDSEDGEFSPSVIRQSLEVMNRQVSILLTLPILATKEI